MLAPDALAHKSLVTDQPVQKPDWLPDELPGAPGIAPACWHYIRHGQLLTCIHAC